MWGESGTGTSKPGLGPVLASFGFFSSDLPGQILYERFENGAGFARDARRFEQFSSVLEFSFEPRQLR